MVVRKVLKGQNKIRTRLVLEKNHKLFKKETLNINLL